MDWDIDKHSRRDVAKIEASWRRPSTIYDVALSSGEGVQKTTRGRSSYPEYSAYDQPLFGAFRWGDTIDPVCVISWADEPGGDRHTLTYPLT